ncbi:hypothetical protein [Microbulbifer thermotolerans]|uniref:Uncharacterized protein n=1 Tax=Microbulbifer thermotolerans TaxID=252514 RepID=A0A143HIT5_MICTH|nr:hypothetical protein [Microbulbifer thermotolerans]AMX01417.1 hypothetical protein A3224_01425 [Microbulbifer thermotolerans]MCX2782026.1 hypothetical protein [Microbulbifer thermotolerans]MCX2783216.1 hypothetical protein [Microbulbifer thermotolerans]WKT60889.1 hypothetical protein Q2E61_01430 [Microbulbifer thermotolerans]SFC36711.1 hypothetical protein SAMN05660479_01610 [Microbulbifer thermotolerans]
MRALAEFIMRGRVRAVLITMVGIPLISPAALALVSLRRGGSDGLMVLAWALLPVITASMSGHMSPLMTGLAISHLGAVFCGALVLRSSRSWSAALVVLTAAAAAGILGTAHFSGGMLQSLLQAAEESGGGQVAQLQQIFGSEPLATGYLCWVSAITATLALVLGRYWQAMLYNPGGFRREFHLLRMPLPLAAAGMLVWVYCLLTQDYVFWGAVVAFPIMVAGIALMHWLVADKGWGRGPLVALYVMLVIAALPLAGFLCGLALIDSWIDIRGRFSKNR